MKYILCNFGQKKNDFAKDNLSPNNNLIIRWNDSQEFLCYKKVRALLAKKKLN